MQEASFLPVKKRRQPGQESTVGPPNGENHTGKNSQQLCSLIPLAGA
jgi:hypothetical protein